MILEWKQFSVNLDRMHQLIKTNLVNYDGMVASSTNLIITFFNEPSQADLDFINDYWNSLTEVGESTPTSFEQLELVKTAVFNAIVFGQKLIVQFSAENVMLGITQAGKTKDVSVYLSELQILLNSGSLYAAIDEIDLLVAQGIPVELDPFITEIRLLEYKEVLQEYLGL